MQNFNQQKPPQQNATLIKSLMRKSFGLSFKLLRIILPPLVGIYAWIYLIPILFPMLKGPIPDREPKTFHQVVMEAKKREAERLRLVKERRAHGDNHLNSQPKYPQE